MGFAVAAALLCAASSLLAGRVQAQNVKTLVVFGDSYSDNCNTWRLTNPANVTAPFPFPNCPPPPTGRADGGRAWPEFIPNISDIHVLNHAYSAATCNNSEFPRQPILDVGQQVQEYFNTKDPSIHEPETTVAGIFIGTNDLGFFTNVVRNASDTSLPPGVQITDETACLVTRIRTLYDAGIRRFLIFQNIPLQDTALYSADEVNGVPQPGAVLKAFMTQLVSANNGLQASTLPQLQSQLRGATIEIFPTFDFYAVRVADPTKFLGPKGTSVGFCNQAAGTCPDPQDFLFWDQLHPGQVADEQLAGAVVSFLKGNKDVVGPVFNLPGGPQ